MRLWLGWSGVASACLLLLLQAEPARAQQLGGVIFGCEPRYGESAADARARCDYDSADNQATRMLENAAEPELLAALARETHEEVRENLIAAIALIDPPGPAACNGSGRRPDSTR